MRKTRRLAKSEASRPKVGACGKQPDQTEPSFLQLLDKGIPIIYKKYMFIYKKYTAVSNG